MKKKKQKLKKLTEKQKWLIATKLAKSMPRFQQYKLRHADHEKRMRNFIGAVLAALHDNSPFDEAAVQKWANEFADAVWPRGSAFAQPRPEFFLCLESFFDAAPPKARITRAHMLLGLIDTCLYCCCENNRDGYESNWDHDHD